MKLISILSVLFILSGCKGGSGGISSYFNSSNNNDEPAKVPPAQVETQKLTQAIQATPEYKIETTEIDTLKTEGLLTEEEEAELKKIQ